MSAKPTVGIDLGTTNSVVAHVDPTGRPACLINFEGDLLTPSAVLIEEENVVVGREARKAATFQPLCYAECFKRHMGEEFFPNPVAGRRWRPEVLSALVLRKLRNDVQRQMSAVESAVITVPAYFDESRRRATQQAGGLAGWDVLDIINEPTAAALAYAHRQGQFQHHAGKLERLLLFDLGGGTFDITVLEVRANQEYRTIATEGEVQLGGHDWDQALAQHLAEQFRTKTKCDPMAEPAGRLEFLHLAQNVKHSLTSRKTVSVPCNYEGHRTLLEVSLETFEQLTAGLLSRSRVTTELILDEAKLTWKQIDKVLLVGGSTRMPMVKRMLRELTGTEPDQSLSADEAVAQGAAVYAHLRASQAGVRVVNVNSHSYRIIALNTEGKKVAAPLIPKNSPLPKKGTKLIPLVRAGMKEVVIHVVEGESDDPEFCFEIGKVRVEDLPQDAAKRWVIGVTLLCQDDGNIAVRATVRDPEAVKTVLRDMRATLIPSRGLGEAELKEARELVAALTVV